VTCCAGQGSRMNLAGDDPEHVVVFPGGLLAPTAKAGLMAAIAGDEVAGGGAMAHPTVILAGGTEDVPLFVELRRAGAAGSESKRP
jgi:hypothetical protein